jgi:hypothetical protein
MSVTILFRGLLVFHKMGDTMEIGFLNAPAAHQPPNPPTMEDVGHVPRITTLRDGVVASVFDLRGRMELDKTRVWELEVTQPLQRTATTYESATTFDRLKHSDFADFRWITDLEGVDLHNRDLTAEIDVRNLRMVLVVKHGRFYTKVISESQVKKQGAAATSPFGCASEVIACDLAFNAGDARLQVQDPGGAAVNTAFTFRPGAVYEFSNVPPDVPYAVTGADKPYAKGQGHFQMYYHHLFRTHPADAFDLQPEYDPNPAPDPFLCGLTSLGKRPTTLV